MKRIFIIAVVTACCLIVSCASIMAHAVGMTQEDKAYKIIPKFPGENRAVAVFYGYEYLQEREDKNAETEMREPNYNHIPKFGYISVRTQGWTASSSNPKNWLFIVQDKNKNEIYRDYGLNSGSNTKINKVGKHYNATWWNLNRIYLEDDVEFPLYLRVVTALDEPVDIIIEKK
jgi:hypothetical protein